MSANAVFFLEETLDNKLTRVFPSLLLKFTTLSMTIHLGIEIIKNINMGVTTPILQLRFKKELVELYCSEMPPNYMF